MASKIEGNLLAVLKQTKLMQLKLDDNHYKIIATKNFLVNDFGRSRSVTRSPEAKIHISSSNGNNNKIIEISK